MKKTQNYKNIPLCALFAALISICAIISVPAFIPFTLQTLAVTMCVYILGTKNALITILVYILLGSVGLPVFSGFQSGVGVLFGATGGFILGFIPMTVLLGITFNKAKRLVHTILGCSVALFSLYLTGTVWLSIFTSMSVSKIILICIVPFLLPDVLKIIAAIFIGRRIKKQTKI